MTTASVRFKSEALGRWVAYQLLLPDHGTKPFPVVIQLHGLSDDSHSWLERSNIARYAEPYPLVIAFPDGETSAYLNWRESGRLNRSAFETAIVEDLSSHLVRHFNVTGGPWGIGGLSMGGYGAMHLGLRYPERFASIWSHSSAFMIPELIEPGSLTEEATPHADLRRNLIDLIASGKPLPVISFDCGVDDELINVNREAHHYLEEMEVEHTYLEYPGAHTWDYWDEHVREALAQHAGVLCGNGDDRDRR